MNNLRKLRSYSLDLSYSSRYSATNFGLADMDTLSKSMKPTSSRH